MTVAGAHPLRMRTHHHTINHDPTARRLGHSPDRCTHVHTALRGKAHGAMPMRGYNSHCARHIAATHIAARVPRISTGPPQTSRCGVTTGSTRRR